MSKYYPPVYEDEQFHCLQCGVYAKQSWGTLKRGTSYTDFMYSQCHHCYKDCYWYKGKMIVPSEAHVAPPHQDLPEACVLEYNEARDIASRSPRAAAALLRLAVQKLMIELGEKGKNINADIGSLVTKGARVVFNNLCQHRVIPKIVS